MGAEGRERGCLLQVTVSTLCKRGVCVGGGGGARCLNLKLADQHKVCCLFHVLEAALRLLLHIWPLRPLFTTKQPSKHILVKIHLLKIPIFHPIGALSRLADTFREVYEQLLGGRWMGAEGREKEGGLLQVTVCILCKRDGGGEGVHV